MSDQSKHRTRLIIGIGIVAVLAIAVVAALSTGGGNGSPGIEVAETQPVTVVGTALPRYPDDGSDDPAVGMPAPEVSGLSFDGTPVSITNDGRPKIILFLAHWCSHCQNDVELLTAYVKDNGLPPDVALYSVATGTDAGAPNYPPSEWLKEWPLPVIADSPQSEAAQAFGLSAFPFFVLVTADGIVDFRFPGEVQPDVLYQAAVTLANS
jgi:cytochrome c biogenesis protein CcmG/thiol:disulfide interchange protein DsbE